MNKNIRITLKSDLCPGSGASFAAAIDTDVTYDAYGLPFIEGKRIKGLLREEALELLSIDQSDTDSFYPLFGEIGAEKGGGLKLGNGTLPDYDERVAEITGRELFPNEVLSCYTEARQRTAIENGCAAKTSLRSIRVINKGIEFVFPVEFPAEYESLLNRSCNLLRHMGMNRTRGLGEVKCQLKNIEGSQTEDTEVIFPLKSYDSDKKQLAYTMYLCLPVISAERSGRTYASEDYIFGSSILGWAAGKWLEVHRSVAATKAHENDEFRRLFLTGNVIYTAAFPYAEGDVFYPALHTIRTNKIKSRFVDESSGQAERQGTDINPICKKLDGFVSTDGTRLRTYKVEKETSLHHSRPNDKKRGHAGGITGDEGQMFSYEAIKRGQTFYGRIIGSESDLRIIAQLLEACRTIYIGRSKTAQYGETHPAPAEVQPIPCFEIPHGAQLRMTVRTPVILTDDDGTESLDLAMIPKLLGHEKLKIVRSFCSETSVAGYNAKWRLPRCQTHALEEGSVLILENGGDRPYTTGERFIGARTESGFGHVVCEPIPGYELVMDRSFKLQPVNRSYSDVLWNQITKRRAAEKANLDGAMYASELKLGNAPGNSQFSRLQKFLKESVGFAEFAKKLFEIKQAKQRLQAFYLFTGKPKDYFTRENITPDSLTDLFSGDYDAYRVKMESVMTNIKLIRRQKNSDGEERSDD